MYITICDSVDVALRLKTVDSQKPVRNSLIVVFRGVCRSVKNNQEWGTYTHDQNRQWQVIERHGDLLKYLIPATKHNHGERGKSYETYINKTKQETRTKIL